MDIKKKNSHNLLLLVKQTHLPFTHSFKKSTTMTVKSLFQLGDTV